MIWVLRHSYLFILIVVDSIKVYELVQSRIFIGIWIFRRGNILSAPFATDNFLYWLLVLIFVYVCVYGDVCMYISICICVYVYALK